MSAEGGASNGNDGWHPANDNLAGTSSYGALSTDHLGDGTWSTPFGSDFTQYLLASGDMSMWVQIARDELASQCAASCAACGMTLLGSSAGGSAVAQYCRTGAAEDPWISAGDHPTHIVYGENGYGGHNADDALNFAGANVWIDALPDLTPAVDIVSARSCWHHGKRRASKVSSLLWHL